MKICNQCKESKAVVNFNNDRRTSDGKSSHCRVCAKVRGIKARSKYKEECRELSDKVLQEKNEYMEKIQDKWRRNSSGYESGERNMYREYAVAFWNQVESRNQQQGEV